MNKKYKRIAINGRFLTRRTTGVERYAIEIVKELDNLTKNNELVLLVPNNLKIDVNLINIEIRKIGHFKGILWEQISFGFYCMLHRYLPLNLCNTAPLIKPGVSTIHDVKNFAHPEFFGQEIKMWYKVLYKNQARRCERIITVSNFSKNEIMKYLGVKEHNIVVAPSSWQHFNNVICDKRAMRKYNLNEGEYFFSMSSMEPNKNFKWVAEVARKNTELMFVIAGGINNRIFANGLGFECPDNMKLIGYITDEEAKCLMKYCKGFLFPTIYEGFGLPPLEAISAGCRSIVVSDTKVMHEVYEDSACYVNPNMYELDINSLKPIEKDILSKYSWSTSSKIIFNVISDFFER